MAELGGNNNVIARFVIALLLGVAQRATIPPMIKSFKHKGLKVYFETGKTSGIQAKHAKKLKMQLAAIDTAQVIDDVDLPGFGLHPLKGSRFGVWSIVVNGNWRITFEFKHGHAYILNYEDYH